MSALLPKADKQQTPRHVGFVPSRRARAVSAARREGFAERDLWNIRPALSGHSGLRPANFTTFAHFSVSSTMNFPKSGGVIGIGTPPRSASRCLILGSARPALNSLLSLSTISAGVPFGAPTPYQVLAS